MGEVAEDLLGVAEGSFGVDVPVLAARVGQHGVELGRIGQMGNGAMALDATVRMGAGEFLEEAATEEACEDFDGGEEGGAAGLPLAGVDIEAGVGDDAMQMGMEQEQLVPGMQDRGAANTGCAVACIGGDLVRQGKDDMEVGHGQDVGDARVQPAPCGEPLAGRTVAIAA